MKQTFNKSRRTFIASSLTVAGGLSLGFVLYTERKNKFVGDSENGFQPNAWLTIEKNDQISIMLTESEMGQGVMTSLPMLIAEELDADWKKIKIIQAPVDPVFGWQGTGGSRSIRQAWEPLRNVGATARQMLLNAAAERWQVPASACESHENKIIHRALGRQLSYGELVPYAVKQDIPDSVNLKSPKEFRFIGKPVPRIDIPAKVTGDAVFGMDVTVPGMMIAAIKQCPVFGGRFASYDKQLAGSINGVYAIVPLKNAIAVVAEDYWTAQQTINQLSVTWDYGKNINTNSSTIEENLKRALTNKGEVVLDRGNAAEILNQGKANIESEYSTPYQAHATMEPMCCTAHVTKDKCEVWAPTQQPSSAQNTAAKVTGLSKANIHIHTTLLGGGFGRRNIQDFVEQSVQISQHIKKPIKLIWSREEDIQHDYYNPATYHRLTASLDDNGLPSAWQHIIAGSSYADGAQDLPYNIPNARVETIAVDTGIPLGPWRSVSYSYNVFATECFIDELAVAAKQDPLDYRLKLLSDNPRLFNVLKIAAEKSNWYKAEHNRLHLGVSITASFGSYVAQVAHVSLDDQGRPAVEKITCVVDCGIVINPDTVVSQIEGSIIYALTATIKSHITIKDGRVAQSNFHDFPLLRFNETPIIDTHLIKSAEPPGGMGEPGVPPVGPAVLNAIYSATRKRFKNLPVLS